MSRFPVVALACSVDGLDGLTQVLPPLPADLPVAVIVLQHVKPGRASEQAAILGRSPRLENNGTLTAYVGALLF